MIKWILRISAAVIAVALFGLAVSFIYNLKTPSQKGVAEAAENFGPKVHMFDKTTTPVGHHQHFYEYGYAVFRKDHYDETSTLYTDNEPTWENGAAMLCVRNSLERSAVGKESVHPGDFCQAVPNDLTYVQQDPEHPALKIRDD